MGEDVDLEAMVERMQRKIREQRSGDYSKAVNAQMRSGFTPSRKVKRPLPRKPVLVRLQG